MAAAPPPLVGYNDNVRYRGLRFHIQTEDSGVSRPHVVTHLFADGGHIIKSIRRDYTEHAHSPSREETVRRMMAEQHKAMAVALKRGRLDEKLDLLPDIEPATALPSAGPETAAATSLSEFSAPGRLSSGPATLPSPTHSTSEAPRSSEASSPRPRKPVGRPSLNGLGAPSGNSLFGGSAQTSLGHTIQGYLSSTSKRTTGKDK